MATQSQGRIPLRQKKGKDKCQLKRNKPAKVQFKPNVYKKAHSNSKRKFLNQGVKV